MPSVGNMRFLKFYLITYKLQPNYECPMACSAGVRGMDAELKRIGIYLQRLAEQAVGRSLR